MLSRSQIATARSVTCACLLSRIRKEILGRKRVQTFVTLFITHLHGPIFTLSITHLQDTIIFPLDC